MRFIKVLSKQLVGVSSATVNRSDCCPTTDHTTPGTAEDTGVSEHHRALWRYPACTVHTHMRQSSVHEVLHFTRHHCSENLPVCHKYLLIILGFLSVSLVVFFSPLLPSSCVRMSASWLYNLEVEYMRKITYVYTSIYICTREHTHI